MKMNKNKKTPLVLEVFADTEKKKRRRVATPNTASISPHTKSILDKNQNLIKTYSLNTK